MSSSSAAEALSPRKLRPEKVQMKPEEHNNRLLQLLQLLLPPFLLKILTFLYRIVTYILLWIYRLFLAEQTAGEASKQFNRRRFEQPIQELQLRQEELGFTNQVLFQETKKTVNLYLPVYITCKIKSIQDVSVQALTGNISCALIVNVGYGQLPEEIVKKLQSSIALQLNRGEVMLLAEDGLTITCKRNKSAQFLIFTVRKVLLAFLIEDNLWSPFELLELVISITLNTVNIAAGQLEQLSPDSAYNPKKQYKISFNCMRNSDFIPISYALDCVYGVYDLAERKLEAYHSRFATYKEIQKHSEEQQKMHAQSAKERQLHAKQKKQQEKKEKERLQVAKKQKQKRERERQERLKQEMAELGESSISISPPPGNMGGYSPGSLGLIREVASTTLRRLSMRLSAVDIKKPPKKVKYFQYTHLIIPLYKYPGNSLITIFLPTFLLALLSLAIFFQQSQLSGRIGAIATMILGYIALIPSIKQQLPPSSKLTVIEAIVYIQTICCMFILYESFIVRQIEDYVFVWYENFNFLLCLLVHSCTFLFVLGLYGFHKLKWEGEYNCDEKVLEIKPADNKPAWDNPYCDQVFVKHNAYVQKTFDGQERQQQLIRVYQSEAKGSSIHNIMLKSQKEVKQANPIIRNKDNYIHLWDHLEQNPIEAYQKKRKLSREIDKQKEDGGQDPCPTTPRSNSEFVLPSEHLYYSKDKNC